MRLRVMNCAFARDADLLVRHAHWLPVHRLVAHHLRRLAVSVLVLGDGGLRWVQLRQPDVLLVARVRFLCEHLLGLLRAVDDFG